eukprot:TRINITY_DN27042_c0_g1_i1.p1 TRINITY_DN27042_c0_g1~~TRINITY_DN27042_c0_g1_i1.p1  ORF type:complete len:387 (-),score=58.45 TRINITY_DN27042_c0_g1_i1:151-1311(-)
MAPRMNDRNSPSPRGLRPSGGAPRPSDARDYDRRPPWRGDDRGGGGDRGGDRTRDRDDDRDRDRDRGERRDERDRGYDRAARDDQKDRMREEALALRAVLEDAFLGLRKELPRLQKAEDSVPSKRAPYLSDSGLAVAADLLKEVRAAIPCLERLEIGLKASLMAGEENAARGRPRERSRERLPSREPLRRPAEPLRRPAAPPPLARRSRSRSRRADTGRPGENGADRRGSDRGATRPESGRDARSRSRSPLSRPVGARPPVRLSSSQGKLSGAAPAGGGDGAASSRASAPPAAPRPSGNAGASLTKSGDGPPEGEITEETVAGVTKHRAKLDAGGTKVQGPLRYSREVAEEDLKKLHQAFEEGGFNAVQSLQPELFRIREKPPPKK